MRLEMLGGLRLLDAEGAPLPIQRRRLALLAIVGVAGRRGVKRERILGLLWPEAREEGARHALDQALSALRRQLGPDCLTRAHALALNPAVVSVDLWEFLDALDAGQGAAAVVRYGGPLLEGFDLSDCPEFSFWVDGERAHLAQRHATALAALGDAALARGDARSAVDWWRRFQQLDPLSARGAAGLIRAHSANSDRASAVQAGRSYEALVRRELGCAPDPAVRAALAAAVITHEDLRPPQPVPAPVPVGTFAAAAGSSSAGARPGITSVPPRRLRWPWALLVVLVGLMSLQRARDRELAPVAERTLAVFPFRVSDASGQFADLGEAIGELLAGNLRGRGGLSVVPAGTLLAAWRESAAAGGDVDNRQLELARRLGAGRVVTGAVTGSDDVLILEAVVTDVRSGSRILELTMRGRRDDVPALVDRLAAHLQLPAIGGDP